MIYLISVLEEADFESLGREMPKGTGIDNSVNDGAVAMGGKRKRKGKQNEKKKGSVEKDSTISLIKALDVGTKSETKLSALRLMLEFGSTEEKLQAMREVRRVAVEGDQESTEPTVTVGKDSEDDDEDADRDNDSDDSSIERLLL